MRERHVAGMRKRIRVPDRSRGLGHAGPVTARLGGTEIRRLQCERIRGLAFAGKQLALAGRPCRRRTERRLARHDQSWSSGDQQSQAQSHHRTT